MGRAHWDPQYEAKEEVVLYDALSGTRTDDNIVFRGKIIEVESDGTPGSERVIYKAYGPRYLAESDVVVRDSNATNSSRSDAGQWAGDRFVVWAAGAGVADASGRLPQSLWQAVRPSAVIPSRASDCGLKVRTQLFLGA